MARSLQILAIVLPFNIIALSYIIFAVVVTMSIVSLVMFLCASHENQKEVAFTMKNRLSLSRKSLLSSFNKANNISSKALLKMISRRKPVHDDQHEEDEDSSNNNDDYYVVNEGFEEGDDAVWKKTIIKGEKCRPLDFSGKIEYDSQGNLVPNHHHKKVITSTNHSNQVVVISK